jgi:hypothetical protein
MKPMGVDLADDVRLYKAPGALAIEPKASERSKIDDGIFIATVRSQYENGGDTEQGEYQ